jgi:tRNA(fMet)-specific endonuclease VapC
VTRYLLDTNILSDLMDNLRGNGRRRLGQATHENVCTSIVCAAELRFGAVRRQSDDLTARAEAILAQIEVIDFSPDADRHYAYLRYQLEREGTPISGNDMLIAAHALALDCVLVTANTREFERIAGLRLDNWLS